MDKLKIIIFVLIGLLVIFFALNFFSVNSELSLIKSPIPKRLVGDCLGLSNAQKEVCFADIKAKLNDKSICDSINDEKRRKECYANAAMVIGENDSDCEAVGQDIKNLCDAAANSDPSYCEDDSCFTDYAIFKNDSSVCRMIPHHDEKEFCMELFE